MGVDRTLEKIKAALNSAGLEEFEPNRVQPIVDACCEEPLTLDSGGGLHEPSGARVGAIRRAPSGEWIIERQNPDVASSDAAIPYAYERGPFRRLLSKLSPR